MTNRLILGVDPGQSGAIAMLSDGEPAGFIDMPTTARRAGGNEVNGKELAARLRGVQQEHTGAYILAVIEAVHAMPKQGSASTFRFGESFGVLKGVLASVGITYCLVEPTVWKRQLVLIGKDKDAARLLAIDMFPRAAHDMQRKKDSGRADALLIAHWADLTEQLPRAA